MSERQRQNRIEASSSSGRSQSGTLVQVETIDGEAVQFEVSGTETVGQMRRIALERLGAVTDNSDKYTVIDSQGRVMEDNIRLTDLASEGQELQFQLLPQPAFGKVCRGD